MKKLWINLFKFTPIIVFMIGVNFFIDPAHLFSENYIKKVGDILLSGENVIGIEDLDERLLQKYIIEEEKECPEVIVLGSSRSLTISKDLVGNERFRNHSVSGANLMDFLGILGSYLNSNKIPKQVIIGIDPWIFNENAGDIRYQSLSKELRDFIIEINGQELLDIKLEEEDLSEKEKFIQIISPVYFQNSIKKLLKNGIISIENTKENNSEKGLRYADGSINYEKKIRMTTIEQSLQAAKDYISGEIYQIENYNKMNERYLVLFEKMVEYLRENRVEIIFYLSPYHPYVYNYLKENQKYRIVLEVEDYCRKYASEKEITIFGSYAPEFSECTEEDFFDGMHMKRESLYKTWGRSK